MVGSETFPVRLTAGGPDSDTPAPPEPEGEESEVGDFDDRGRPRLGRLILAPLPPPEEDGD